MIVIRLDCFDEDDLIEKHFKDKEIGKIGYNDKTLEWLREVSCDKVLVKQRLSNNIDDVAVAERAYINQIIDKSVDYNTNKMKRYKNKARFENE